jgi:SAM-dependent methyltransferase
VTTESTETTASLYDVLGPIYDAWQSADGMTPFALVAHAKLEPALARFCAGEVGSFLDLGCGTGELLLALARAHPGWRLTGVDASAGMLAAAAAKPGAGEILWLRASLDERLPLAHPFDAAGAFYDTLNHLPDEAALARALAVASEALRPGGLFVFDLTNALGFERWWRGRNRWAGPGWSVAVETRYDRASHTGHARVTLGRGDRTQVLALGEREFADRDVRAALGASNLVVEGTDTWSPFDLDAPGKTLWITRKQP